MVWLTRVHVKWHGLLEGHRKVSKLILPIHRKGDRSECTCYWGISLLSLPGKEYAKCLVKRCREIIEPKLGDTNVVFVAAVGQQNKIPLSIKFSRNLGNMPKTYTHVLSTSGKHTTGFLVKSLVECFGSMVLTAACYWPWSHFIPAQKFGSVSTELITTVHRGCWTPTSVCCCHHSSP